jgi:methylated-DNA-[protein]-cysteine S-methyltransferase
MTILFAVFDTAIGRCALAWSARGVAGVQLPEADEAKTRRRVLQQFPGARERLPSPEMTWTRDALTGLLRGMPSDLSSVSLDMDSLPPFHRRVYEAARAIPWRTTATYGTLARIVGAAGRPAPWDKLSHGTRTRSSCPVIGWSPRAARPAVSRRMAARR